MQHHARHVGCRLGLLGCLACVVVLRKLVNPPLQKVLTSTITNTC